MAEERNAKQQAADAVWEEAKKDIDRHDEEQRRTNESGK